MTLLLLHLNISTVCFHYHLYFLRSGVPNLGYMYPLGYICLSEGVHWRLLLEEQNISAYNLFPNIYTYVSEFSFQKSLYVHG